MIRNDAARELAELRARYIRVTNDLTQLFSLRDVVKSLANDHEEWRIIQYRLDKLDSAATKLSTEIDKLSKLYDKPTANRARKPSKASRQSMGHSLGNRKPVPNGN